MPPWLTFAVKTELMHRPNWNSHASQSGQILHLGIKLLSHSALLQPIFIQIFVLEIA